MLIAFSVGNVWATDPVEIASGTFNGKNETYTSGWSTTGTGKGRTDCIIIGSGENITSPSIDLSDYESISITFTGRRYGQLSNSKAVVNVAFGGSSIGSIDISNGSVGTVSGSVDHTITTETTGTFVFTCTNATSAGSTHGAGIGSITITGVEKSSTPAVAYTVSFNVGGSSASQADITEASAGAGIELPAGPTPTCSADGWTFAGWKETSAVAEQTTIAPTLLSGTYHPTENCTLYAVYSRSEGTPETWNKVTSAPSDWSGDYVLVNSGYAMTSDFSVSGEFAGAEVTITNSKVTSPTNKMIWTFAKNGNQAQYSLLNKATGTYAEITGTSSKNAGLSETAVWFTLSLSTSNVWQISSVTKNGRCFAYYSNNFRTYTNTTASNGVDLYKKSGGATYYYLSAPTCTPPAVADPVISLASGEYEGTQSVTISCETTGAKIYYTTDESDPTASSTLYNGDISVSASQTIKAIAIKDDASSNIVSAEYTIITTCETPTFSLAAGEYEGTQSVEISCSRAGVAIYYTTNGDDPTASSILYTGAISVSATQTIRAIATKVNLANSAIASATYTIIPGPDVTLDLMDGNWSFPTSNTTELQTYTNSVTGYSVKCYAATQYKIATDYFFIGKANSYIELPTFSNPVEKIVVVKGNGNQPSGSVEFNIYDGDDEVSDAATGCATDKEFIIKNPKANNTYTLKVASAHNLQISAIKIYFGEAPAVAQPTISGNAAFVGSQDVTITCETDGATIYYTTDATEKDDPSTENWTLYDTKVTLNESCTLYAAAKKGDDWSSVASKAFTATPLYTSIEALQDVATENEATVFVQMTDWLVTAVSGSNAYVTDGSGKGMVLYKYNHGFAQGDKLNKEQLQTTLQNYQGTYELKNLTTADFAGEGELVQNEEITPVPKTATEYAALTNANQGVLYVVNNLVYDETNHKFMDGVNEIAYYNKFSIDESSLVDGHTYSVTGVAVYYNGGASPVVQLCPRAASDLVDNTAHVQISFDANTTETYGGTLPTTVNHISGTDYTVPDACLTRTDGYYQLGWNTDKDATTALSTLNNVTSNQILYAIWKETENCTITFYSKGAEYTQKVVAQNVAYDFNDVADPTVQGWTFYGWSESEIATEEASATVLDSYTPTSDTKSLYAVFSRKVSGTPYTQYEKVTSEPADWSGEYLLVYENSATQGYVWDGTDASSNYKTAGIASGVISTKPTDAALLTIAAYSTGHSILINGGTNDGKYLKGNGKNTALLFGDDADVVTISCESNGTELLFTQRSIRYMDGRFRYYSDEKALGWLYRENMVTPQSDVYTTDPVVRYNITFVLASGEEGTFNPISVKAGESATLPTSVPTKSHNAFLKWSDGENEYEAGETIENVQADKELHATWEAETPATVTFNLNGASGSISAIENLYGGDPYQLPAAPAYDDAHAFAGWSDGVNTYTAEAAMTMTTPAADVEYVAQWNDVTYDQVVILAKYAGNWYAVKAAAGEANHTILGVQVDYRYGNIYDEFTPEQKAVITWTRKTVGNQMSFKNGDNYLKAASSNDLDLDENECFWTCDASADPAKYYTHIDHTILYSGSAEVFKNYKSSNATDGETGAYSALPIVTAAKFNTTYTRPGAVQGQLGTICLPNGGKMEGATPFEISYMDYDTDNNPYKIYLDEVEEMVAGRPYIFLSEDENPDVKVYYTDTENASAGNYRGLYGTFSDIDQLEQGYYIIYNNMYYHVNTDNVKILANRAYIKLSEIPGNEPAQDPDPTKVRRRISMSAYGTQTATGINALNASDAPVKVLINGQLFIIRGEKMFDAKGQLVK